MTESMTLEEAKKKIQENFIKDVMLLYKAVDKCRFDNGVPLSTVIEALGVIQEQYKDLKERRIMNGEE